MALQQNFRTALNGFNREDVVHYIEQVNAKHHAESNRLHSDLQYLKEQLARYELADEGNLSQLFAGMEQQIADLEEKLANAQADDGLKLENAEQARQIDTLEQRLDRNQTSHRAEVALLEEKISQQNEEICSLRCLLAEAQEAAQQAQLSQARTKEENEGLQALLDTALSRQSHVQSQQEAELSAYRRAERVERQARERAVQISHRANGILADATAKMDEAAVFFTDAAELVMQQIQCLQNAVSDSKLILKDASACLYTINPDEE